ncbi:MAG: FAD-dependent oxidoreductase, partial [Thermoleophilia bacterium]
MNTSEAKKEIAVLGGGVGGLTAAFELTATPELRDRHSVTVYQLGWRLGGKGASGRNADHSNRIEEHGLHVWFGFYDNAFRLMRDAYAELGRDPGAPLAGFDDAFKPCDQLVLYDRQGDGWYAHRFDCPRNPLSPGDAGELPTFWEVVAEACGFALKGWRLLRDQGLVELDDLDVPFVPDWFE